MVGSVLLSALFLLKLSLRTSAFSIVGSRRAASFLPAAKTRVFQRQLFIRCAVSSLQNEVDEVEEWDEDAVNKDAVFGSYKDYEKELNHLVTVSSRDETASKKAMQVLDRMFQAHIVTDDVSLWPDVPIYNLLLQVHAYSKDPEAMDAAELIVQRMEDTTNSGAPPPNLETYDVLMEGWNKRKLFDKVQTTFYQLHASGTLDTNIYNKLIQAVGMAGDADKALSILEGMLQNDDATLRPNEKTWVQVLRAFASRGDSATVKSLLTRMEQSGWKPTKQAYNALLEALSKTSSKEAESVLYQMMAADLVPDNESFYHVIHSYRNIKDTAGTAFKVEKLLSLQDALVKQHGGGKLHPTARTLTAAVAVVAKDRTDSKKAVKAKRIFDRIEHFNLYAVQCLLKACAYTARSSEATDKLAAFQIAIDAFNQARQLQGQTPQKAADCSSIYGLFLCACHNLMPATKKRDAVLESSFRQCCAAGYVNDFVLEQLERAASDELVLKLLGGFFEDGVEPPAEWSRNVLEQRRAQQ